MTGRILEGIMVLDVGSFIAGPAAATVMSDFGAEVIKVEPPSTGDPYRDLLRLPGMPLSEHNYPWLLDSRNKKSLALDLKVPEGREALLTLVARADVYLTNYPPGVLGRLRLAWEDLSAVNPRLVYASLTGYGEVGEEANKPGFDVNAWWARSAMMDLVRQSNGPPASSMPGMGDHPTSVALFGAIMLGLFQRERTGRGTKVSTSLMANGAWANSVLIQGMLAGAAFVERPPRERALNALINFYQCRDGRWFSLTMLREEKDWERFAFIRESKDLLERRLRECIGRGLLPADLDPEAAFNVLASGIHGVAVMRLCDRPALGEDADALARDVIEVTLAGLRGGARLTFAGAHGCAPAPSSTTNSKGPS